jgi:hypothetical protein
MKMPAALKSLTFTTLTKIGTNPVLDRRARIIARLEEQKALLADPTFTRTIKIGVKQDGVRTMTEKQQRVLKWWGLHPSGSYAFCVRNGWKVIEFEKGKSAIAVPSLDHLPSAIDTLITAVRNGELDDQLAQTTKKPIARKPRKAS